MDSEIRAHLDAIVAPGADDDAVKAHAVALACAFFSDLRRIANALEAILEQQKSTTR